jgi:hypothetical protein
VITLFSGLAAASPVAALSATGAVHSKRVCAVQPAGYVACDARVVTDANLHPLATTTYQSGYNPARLRKAYGLTNDVTSTVAIVDAYANPNAAADLAAYRSQFGLGPVTLTQVNQSGVSISTVSGNVGWGQEEMFDLEMISAICPSYGSLHVGANSASFTDLATAVDTGANGATVISNSYGGNEFSGEVSIATHYNKPGIAITVSSGDRGYGAQALAAFNTVTAVGGTTLTLNSDEPARTRPSGAAPEAAARHTSQSPAGSTTRPAPAARWLMSPQLPTRRLGWLCTTAMAAPAEPTGMSSAAPASPPRSSARSTLCPATPVLSRHLLPTARRAGHSST